MAPPQGMAPSRPGVLNVACRYTSSYTLVNGEGDGGLSIHYTHCTGKYHKSVASTVTSATDTSNNTGKRQYWQETSDVSKYTVYMYMYKAFILHLH